MRHMYHSLLIPLTTIGLSPETETENLVQSAVCGGHSPKPHLGGSS